MISDFVGLQPAARQVEETQSETENSTFRSVDSLQVAQKTFEVIQLNQDILDCGVRSMINYNSAHST